MDTDRRGFLRLTAGATALLLPLQARGAGGAGAQTALGIHRATRNTRTGAIGMVLRAGLRGTLPPFKAYAGLPRDALAMPSWETGRALFSVVTGYRPARAIAPDACSREQLARILFLANGVTRRGGSTPLRAAPSAGALYAGELYAVVERISGLAPGVHYYDVDAHALVLVRGGSFLAEVALAIGAAPEASRAAAAVLITNVFARYDARYANRGYRYALIDAGHIGENLRLAAGELGLGEAAPARFEDDRLNTLLGVDGRKEAVCAVHWVGRAAEPRSDAMHASGLVERQVAEPAQQERWSGRSDPERYHEATKLVRAVGAGAAPAETSPETGPPAGESAAPRMPVHAAIRTRRSTRRFESRVLPRADLLAILALARHNPSLYRSTGLDLYAVVHRVADTPAGLYRYEPAAGRLAPLRRGELAGALVRACLGQEKTGQAAAAIVGVARVAEASARGGARSYRDLLLDAGATAQRIYLGAEALGLTARNLAAYYDDELDALLGLAADREVAVHLTAVGAGD